MTGRHAVARDTSAVHLIMVDLDHRLPLGLAMAGFTHSAAVDVAGRHAVTRDAGAIDLIVIHLDHRLPFRLAMASLAHSAAVDVT